MTGFSDYDSYDGLGLAELVNARQVSPLELLEEAIARTERVNGAINAVVHTLYDEAAQVIARGLPAGNFQGVPFLLKDLDMHLAGQPLTNGSRLWRNYISEYDSTLVKRYRQAGLTIFGKTNTPEMGLNPITESELLGPCRNPWDIDRTAGGSSGGAAAAVAAGILPVAHASDGGGSIRIPAACCGLVGFKPSRGRIPHGPHASEHWGGQSTSHVISRTVRDSAAMLDATAGSEPGEPYTAPHFAGRFLDESAREPARLRIAFSRSKWGRGDYSAQNLAGLDATLTLLNDLGHELTEASPDFDGEHAGFAMYTVAAINTALKLQQYAQKFDCNERDLPVEAGTRMTAELGKSMSGTDYLAALQTNQALGRLMAEFLVDYDVLLAPTTASPAIPIGHITQAPRDAYSDRLFAFFGDTAIYNQTGQPSVSLPLWQSPEGLPIGMMFSAAYGKDALLLQLATQLERAAPWRDRQPPVHAAAATDSTSNAQG
ncbi:MAG: amidase [Pseudomonadota bacterium]